MNTKHKFIELQNGTLINIDSIVSFTPCIRGNEQFFYINNEWLCTQKEYLSIKSLLSIIKLNEYVSQ